MALRAYESPYALSIWGMKVDKEDVSRQGPGSINEGMYIGNK